MTAIGVRAAIRGVPQLMIVALLVSAACSGESEAPEGRPGGPSSERLSLKPAGSAGGPPLGYAEYLPPGYGDGIPRPLLIFLHGSGENGDGSEAELDRIFKLGIPKLIEADEWGEDRAFVVLMPQYGFDRAQDCGLAGDIDAFLAFAMDRYDVDADRVYLTGVSCGAIGAWDYLATHTDEVVAGAVLISGHAEDAFAQAGCELGRVPIWAFHGASDSVVPQVHIQEPIAELKACTDPPPVEVRLTIYPGADHNVWGRTYDLSAGHDVYAWLLDHAR